MAGTAKPVLVVAALAAATCAASEGLRTLLPGPLAAVGQVLSLADGSQATCQAVVWATGVSYRLLPVPRPDKLMGARVFCGAAVADAFIIHTSPRAAAGVPGHRRSGGMRPLACRPALTPRL